MQYAPSSTCRLAAICLLLALLLGAGRPAHAQLDRWRTHTSLRQVTDLSVSDEAVWAATSGGIFRYDVTGGGEMQAMTAGEGLHSVRTRALAYDERRDVVWIGYEDGVLDRFDPATGAVETFRDIARADRFPGKSIHRIAVHGDSVLVATSFGLVVFDPVRGEVRDTYSRLGTLSPATPVHDVVVGPAPSGGRALWLATEGGVAYASLATLNLQDPAAWTVEEGGLPSTDVRSLAFFDGTLYAGTAAGLARRGAGGVYADLGVTSTPVVDLAPSADRLLGVERFSLVVVERSGAARRVAAPGFQDPTSVVVGPAGTVWFGDGQGGLNAVEIPPAPATQLAVTQPRVYPAGPFHNFFSDLTFGPDGALWAAGVLASQEFPNTGFYRMDPDGSWTDYIASRVPAMEGLSSFERIHVDARGNAWAGSAGGGLVQVTPEGDVRHYDAANSTLQSAAGATGFVIVGGVASEPDGTLWVTNRAAPADLHVRTPDGAWSAVPGFSCDGFSTVGMTLDRITIDSFGQKWIVVVDEANLRRTLGLLVLDTGETPVQTGDDACRFFDTVGQSGQHLPSTTVTAVAEDRDGLMWIGTDEGLAYVINNGLVARDPASTPIWPLYADRTQGQWLLNASGLGIHDLARDPANRLWVATDLGAYLVGSASGGYEIVEHFTAETTPLFSDRILSIAVSPQTGRVFLATDRGLLSYEGEAIAPVEQSQTLRVYPNPLRIAEGAEPSVTIEGLVEATELRVVAPHGEVVARLATRGGRARWDGRDVSGRLVPSGMYLVIAVGQNGEGAAYGKVAVIR